MVATASGNHRIHVLISICRHIDDDRFVLKEAIAVNKPVIVDVPTYRYENVYPMIPAGGCNHEMILEDPPALRNKQSGAGQVAPKDSDTILTA